MQNHAWNSHCLHASYLYPMIECVLENQTLAPLWFLLILQKQSPSSHLTVCKCESQGERPPKSEARLEIRHAHTGKVPIILSTVSNPKHKVIELKVWIESWIHCWSWPNPMPENLSTENRLVMLSRPQINCVLSLKALKIQNILQWRNIMCNISQQQKGFCDF